jgi:hypothetical protein
MAQAVDQVDVPLQQLEPELKAETALVVNFRMGPMVTLPGQHPVFSILGNPPTWLQFPAFGSVVEAFLIKDDLAGILG